MEMVYRNNNVYVLCVFYMLFIYMYIFFIVNVYGLNII